MRCDDFMHPEPLEGVLYGRLSHVHSDWHVHTHAAPLNRGVLVLHDAKSIIAGLPAEAPQSCLVTTSFHTYKVTLNLKHGTHSLTPNKRSDAPRARAQEPQARVQKGI